MALVVKNPTANAGDRRGVGLIPEWGTSLEEGSATRSSIFPWEIPWTEEPGGLQSMGSQRVIFAKVESLSHVRLFTTSWTAAYQARVLEWGAIAFSAWWD